MLRLLSSKAQGHRFMETIRTLLSKQAEQSTCYLFYVRFISLLWLYYMAINRLNRYITFLGGGGNHGTWQEPPANPKSLPTSSHAPAGMQTLVVMRDGEQSVATPQPTRPSGQTPCHRHVCLRGISIYRCNITAMLIVAQLCKREPVS